MSSQAEAALDLAPCGFVTTEPSGLIVHANLHFLEATGYSLDDLVGRRRFQELLGPGGQIYYETHYSPLLIMQGAVREIAVDLRGARGDRIPVLINAVLDRDDDGEPVLIRTTVFGARDRRRYEIELLRQRERAERSEEQVRALQRVAAELATAAGVHEVGTVLVDAALRAVDGDRVGLWLLERRSPDDQDGTLMLIAARNLDEFGDLERISVQNLDAFVGRLAEPLVVDSPERAEREFPVIAAAMARLGLRTVAVVPLDYGNRRIGLLGAGCGDVHSLDAADRELLQALGRQGSQALERAELHADAVRAAERTDFLARLGHALEEEVGLKGRAERLVTLATARLGEIAGVELADGDTTRRIAHDRTRVEGTLVEPAGLGELVTAVVAGGRPQLMPERVPGSRPAHWWLVLPLGVPGRTIGALVLCRRGRGFDADEVAYCHEVAQRAALALENARRYEHEREVAYTLQRSLLAGSLPRRPGVRIATHYRAAVESLEVGGDWYDAFALDDERVAIVVGDVVGRGLTAATAMGQIRSAIRALAGAGSGPAALVEHLDRFVAQFDAGRMATVIYLELTPRTGHVRYACAGHFPPLVVQGDEPATYLWDGRSAPLHAYAGQPGRPEAELTLAPGARLLLYTDGLVERRGRLIWEGLELLRGELDARRHATSAVVVSELADTMLRDEPGRDDVCLLCVSLAEPDRFAETIEADLGALSGLRHRLRGWLARHRVDRHDGFAVVLACSEAVGNAIEHGYRAASGTVAVRATVVDDRVDLTVRDRGSWRPREVAADRGRGLMLMRRLMDDVEIERAGGTTVSMTRKVGRSSE